MNQEPARAPFLDRAFWQLVFSNVLSLIIFALLAALVAAVTGYLPWGDWWVYVVLAGDAVALSMIATSFIGEGLRPWKWDPVTRSQTAALACFAGVFTLSLIVRSPPWQ